jgi:phage baseplate assembly protein V
MNFGVDEDRIHEMLNQLIKIGEVSNIYPDRATARVVFDDDDSIVSAELKVLQKNTFANRDYGLPDIGEDVVCLFLPCGVEDGFILGSFYAGEVEPHEDHGKIRTVVFNDDTRIGYDREAHKLFIEIDKNQEKTIITADQEEIFVQVGKDKTTVRMDDAKIDIDTTKTVDIKAPSIKLDGNVQITGTLDVAKAVTTKAGITDSKDVVSSGISLVTHTHGGCQGGTTSSPV